MSQPPVVLDGPRPSDAQIKEQVKKAVTEVGAGILTMRVLRKRLVAEFRYDFSSEGNYIESLVVEVIKDPEVARLISLAKKEKDEGLINRGKKKSSKRAKEGEPHDEKTKKVKHHRAEGEPKHAQNAYMFFSAEVRQGVQQENPTFSLGEIGKKIGEMWAQLSTEEKEKYQTMANDDKERYQRELADFRAKGGVSSSKRKEKKERVGPKRPQSGYFFFINEVRPELQAQGHKITEISKIAGERWKAFSDEDKVKYHKLARQDQERYVRECKEQGIPVKELPPIKDDEIPDPEQAVASESSDDDEAPQE